MSYPPSSAPRSTHTRTFPIRTSQSQRRGNPAATFPYAVPSDRDRYLRRKTSNSTLESVYDGSLQLPLSHAPLPPTQMMVPSAAGAGLLSSAAPSWQPILQQPTRQALGIQPTPADNYNYAIPQQSANGDFWQQSPAFQLPSAMLSHQPVVFNSNLPTSLYNSYQPINRASEHNMRAFCPPPQPFPDNLPFGQGVWQPDQPYWNPNQHFVAQSATVYPQQSSSFSDTTGFWPQRAVHQDYPAVNTPIPHMPFEPGLLPPNLESLSLEPMGAKPPDLVYPPQPRFKEKALQGAHEAYSELLAHADMARRSASGKINSEGGTQASPRLFVFPKPPNPFSFNAASINGNTTAGTTGSDYSHGHRTHPIVASGTTSIAGPLRAHSRSTDSHPGGDAFVGVQRPAYPQMPVSAPIVFQSGWDISSSTRSAHPVTRAKFSLELMNSLCEQDGWKWTSGMLLVGCLNYALGNYAGAYDNFSRVIAVDPSHVVAIVNLAATLFCLDRQTEAEQQWLKAIHLCPAYLEAAEHLVGLLYRKKSTEAIDIVNFIQKSLKLPVTSDDPQSEAADSRSHHAHVYNEHSKYGDLDGQRAGFGSSGYALPGSENGRMLALVHAKGTMLYSLKRISQASKAFEEAVMIGIGRRIDSIRHLVHRVQNVLAPNHLGTSARPSRPQAILEPLLLPPERARQTAQLVFTDGGELPGLMFVARGSAKRAATTTTSNSLLSLAKILQDSMSSGASGASFLGHATGVGDILALYYLSLSLQESPSTANNVGILLAGIQQAALSRPPPGFAGGNGLSTIPGVMPGSGLALALAYYQYGLRLDPRHVHLHTNLGSLLKDIGQLDLAIQMYEQAVSCDGTFDIALTNLANAVKDRGRVNEAIGYYRRAVKANPDFAEAVCGLFTALNSVCDWKGRGGAVLDSGKFDRWHVGEDGALIDCIASQRASGLAKRVVGIVARQLGESSHWGRNILQDDIIDVLVGDLSGICSTTVENLRRWLREWKGKPWEGSRVLRLAERAVRVKLRRWYHDQYVSGVKSVTNYWRPKLPTSLTVPSAPTILPFHTFTCPLGPETIRSISQRNAARISCSTLKASWLPSMIYPPPPPPEPQLNIGYLSSDFNNHPLAHLMQSVFGFHNPRRVRAFCYATTPSDKSCYRQKIEREAPVFRDVSSWAPDRLAAQIVKDQIHILVNLNGYTRGARNEIFAARPAPIQMSFMGFAGTLGSEWCDYILADTTAIPPSTLRPWRENVTLESVFHDGTENESGSWVYSENIIFCRDTFFCCDHAQSSEPDERQVTWEQEQSRRWRMRQEIFPALSDDTIILGNFNQLYKIDPTIFRSWLRILARVPKAVLWLLRFPELGEANLRSAAELWAGPEVASRLLFTEVAPKGQHIARARVCDIFLDTPECNAHTTAADVLWSSTPILTFPRYPYKMCSRMAASIVKGALPKSEEGQKAAAELIVSDEDGYERQAIALAGTLRYVVDQDGYGKGQGRLADIRKLLWDNRWSCALFDTRRWVDDLEMAYEEAWRRWTSGEGGDIYL